MANYSHVTYRPRGVRLETGALLSPFPARRMPWPQFLQLAGMTLTAWVCVLVGGAIWGPGSSDLALAATVLSGIVVLRTVRRIVGR